ncbi:MAG: HupE/UreJ family protein, partial [Verrucomicrobia bacterium]|nr:HupE/UreJ family protein [Verrucomicrobiota bacterium]
MVRAPGSPTRGRGGRTFAWCVLALLLLPGTAQAHTESGIVGGFLSGFRHPVSGLDHLVA